MTDIRFTFSPTGGSATGSLVTLDPTGFAYFTATNAQDFYSQADAVIAAFPSDALSAANALSELTATAATARSNIGAGTYSLADNSIVAARFSAANTDRLFGRDTAGAGAGEEISLTGGLEFTGSGSIQVGAFTGNVTKAAGGTALTIADGAVSNAMIRDSVATSVIGRSANSTGDVADISTTTSGHVLRRSGTALGFGTLISASFADNTITAARMSFTAGNRLVARTTTGSGAGAEHTLTAVLDWLGAVNGNVLYRNTSGAWTAALPDVAGLVDKTNNQTVAGVKTFSSAPVLSAGLTAGNHLVVASTTNSDLFSGAFTGDGNEGARLYLEHISASPAANDIVASFQAYGRDSIGTTIRYGIFGCEIVSPTNAADESRWGFTIRTGGVAATPFYVGKGVYSSTATGGDKGLGTANFTAIYQNNVALGSAAFQNTGSSGSALPFCSGTNSWSGQNTFTNTGGAIFLQSTSPAIRFDDTDSTADARRSQIRQGGDSLIFAFINDLNGNEKFFVRAFCNTTQDCTTFQITTTTFDLNATSLALSGALFTDGATGGSQGAGTGNFTAVYDDGSILCAPWRKELTKQDWDALVIQGERYRYEFEVTEPREGIVGAAIDWFTTVTGIGANKQVKVVSETITGGEHITYKRYMRMRSDGLDEDDSDSYFKYAEKYGAVPGLWTYEEFKERLIDDGIQDKISSIERNERMMLALDLATRAMRDMNNKINVLINRVRLLEAALDQR